MGCIMGEKKKVTQPTEQHPLKNPPEIYLYI